MPSPFPGIDPFVESQAWSDFHLRIINGLADAITPSVRPKYVVRIEERVYLEHLPDEEDSSIRPDLTVLRGDARSRMEAAASVAVVSRPVHVTLPIPEEVKQRRLTVRLRESMEVVCVIEVLSPTNKRPGSDGRRDYLEKREEVLRSQASLVELDLLRGGVRLPVNEPLPAADYYAIVSPSGRRPGADVYFWNLREALTAIPIPLERGDDGVMIDLQEIVSGIYERASYDYSLDYSAHCNPSLSEADAGWVQGILAGQKRDF